jgi:hypothetical protein
LIAGAGGGLATAVVALNSVGLSGNSDPANWQRWNLAEDSLSLPYALGHFLTAGQVPPTNASKQYVRRTDNTGKGLNASCTAVVAGVIPATRWWTLAATANNGTTTSKRGVLNAGQAVVDANGQLHVRIGREPMPGNWLVPPSNGAFMLVLTLHDPVTDIDIKLLPSVTLEGC